MKYYFQNYIFGIFLPSFQKSIKEKQISIMLFRKIVLTLQRQTGNDNTLYY